MTAPLLPARFSGGYESLMGALTGPFWLVLWNHFRDITNYSTIQQKKYESIRIQYRDDGTVCVFNLRVHLVKMRIFEETVRLLGEPQKGDIKWFEMFTCWIPELSVRLADMLLRTHLLGVEAADLNCRS